MLLASAPYMLVDARLRQRYPVLRPAQFLSRSTAFLDDWQAREDRKRSGRRRGSGSASSPRWTG